MGGRGGTGEPAGAVAVDRRRPWPASPTGGGPAISNQIWPLAARDGELAAVVGAVRRGASVVLVGEPGVGKTRLLRAALAELEQTGEPVWLVDAPHGTDPDRPGSLLVTLAAHVDARERPVVLGIDDAHLLESGSAAMVHHLVATGRVRLIAAVCSGEYQHRGVSRLWLERLAERFDLAEFGENEVHTMVRARLGGSVDAATLTRLHRLTRGNALYLCELVGHALTEGTFGCDEGVWRWSGQVTSGSRLADLVRLRLAELEPDEVELVTMVALAEPLEADLPVVAELSAAAESLNRRRIVVADGTGRRVALRLNYPLYSEVLVDSLPELTARRLRVRLAAAIERTGLRRHTDLPRAVRLRLDAGQLPAPADLIEAAQRAADTCDVEFVERLCRLAVAVREPALARARIEPLLARALTGQGRHAEAEEVFRRHHDRAQAQLPADVVRSRALNLAGGLGQIEQAEALLADAQAAAHPDEAATLPATRAIVWLFADRVPPALTLMRSAIAGERADSPLVREALPLMALARTELGDAAGALHLLDVHAGALDRWADRHWLPHQLATAHACLALGRSTQSAAALREVHTRLTQTGGRTVWNPLAVLVEARHLRLCGQAGEALELLRRACGSGAGPPDAVGGPYVRAWLRAQLAGALAETGAHAEAILGIAAARALCGPDGGLAVVRGWVAIEEIVVFAHAGDRSKAVALALQWADTLLAAGRVTRAVEVLHVAARVGVARAAAARCAALVARIGAQDVAHVRSAHVQALADGNGDALLEVSRRFAQAGLLPLAAEAALQAAVAHEERGEHRRGRLVRRRAADLAARCQGPLPPWVCAEAEAGAPATPADGLAVPGGELTPREREVAGFAAVGLSNREIASRLVVSVRTVENHLQRVYGKLGVLRRTDLALRLQDASAFGRTSDLPLR